MVMRTNPQRAAAIRGTGQLDHDCRKRWTLDFSEFRLLHVPCVISLATLCRRNMNAEDLGVLARDLGTCGRHPWSSMYFLISVYVSLVVHPLPVLPICKHQMTATPIGALV